MFMRCGQFRVESFLFFAFPVVWLNLTLEVISEEGIEPVLEECLNYD